VQHCLVGSEMCIRDRLSRLRLGWFVAIAALRDWRLPDPDQH
jgi:hypothetical protein